jgi:hypothetical protein
MSALMVSHAINFIDVENSTQGYVQLSINSGLGIQHTLNLKKRCGQQAKKGCMTSP